MKQTILGLSMIFVLTTSATAAGINYKNFKSPEITEASFNDSEFAGIKKEWTKQNRKAASEMTFQESDLSPDFIKLRDEWLATKNGDEMEALLKSSYDKYDSYSDDTKYFLAQMHVSLPLRGIIWKLRPLFEARSGFFGNKSSHVMAVQAVRTAISGLKIFLPTAQTDAAIQFFTEPSPAMSKADQFQSIAAFQSYMLTVFAPKLNESANRVVGFTKQPSIYVWDNKMAFGRATFEDDLNRFIGHGPAEKNFTAASLYKSYHDILVYCAYNQDYSIKLQGEIGAQFGIDSGAFVSRAAELGLSDQERVALVKSAAAKHQFLELRNYDGSDFGSKMMKMAYIALKNSIVYSERSYNLLQGQEASKSMVINPVLFQPELAPQLDRGVKNMKSLVTGASEVRDPVTGDTVSINVPAFYNDPPKSLSVLLATDFEGGELEKEIKNNKGQILKVRNYLHGRSIGWNNEAWKKYVPSADGKKANYMSDARRVMKYSQGTSVVFGLADMFVH